ncbi:MAG: hypothetical protein A2Z71_02810 [Chloroflexi bacterium RBG_13_50_21]|nr:MAG: hypothetical protein A2Z71_02810 [Chloroflexi bacterium RBG_13_50_21]
MGGIGVGWVSEPATDLSISEAGVARWDYLIKKGWNETKQFYRVVDDMIYKVVKVRRMNCLVEEFRVAEPNPGRYT